MDRFVGHRKIDLLPADTSLASCYQYLSQILVIFTLVEVFARPTVFILGCDIAPFTQYFEFWVKEIYLIMPLWPKKFTKQLKSKIQLLPLPF